MAITIFKIIESNVSYDTYFINLGQNSTMKIVNE